MGRHDWYIECRKIQGFVRELIDRCENSRNAEIYSGVSRQTMYRIVNETCQGVQPETARKLLEALARKRIEDRKAKRVSDRYLTTRQRQARFEERLERMSGY